MRRLIAVAFLAAALAGCAKGELPALNLSNAVTLNSMVGVEGAYGLALSAERAYKALPLCRTGTTTTATNVCARRSIVVKLQAADRKAIAAMDAANTFIKNYPTVDASNVIAAASAAVDNLKAVLHDAGVQ